MIKKLLDRLSLPSLTLLTFLLPSRTLFNSFLFSLISTLSHPLQPFAFVFRIYASQRLDSGHPYFSLPLPYTTACYRYRSETPPQCECHPAGCESFSFRVWAVQMSGCKKPKPAIASSCPSRHLWTRLLPSSRHLAPQHLRLSQKWSSSWYIAAIRICTRLPQSAKSSIQCQLVELTESSSPP